MRRCELPAAGMKQLLLLTAIAVPALADFETPLAITQARIVTGQGDVIDAGTILIDKGRIVAVGRNVEIPAHADTFDAKGLTVYPGFIDAMSHLGIPEAPRSAEERQRTEDLNPDEREDPLPAMHGANRRGIAPQLRAIDKFSPDAKALDDHRSGGFTAVLATPRPGILAGTADLVNLSGDPIRRIVLAPDVGMFATFEPTEPGEYPRTLLGVMALFRQVMHDAKAYPKQQKYAQRHAEAPRVPADAALEALQPVLTRATPLIFEANTEREIHRALDLAREFNAAIVISGGKEAFKAIDRLKAERIAVIATLKFDDEPEFGKKDKKPAKSEQSASSDKAPDEKEPDKIYEPLKVRQERRRLWEEQVTNAIRLHEAGVPVALRTREFGNTEDFFKALALLVERGLTEEAAVALLSTNPAAFLGRKSAAGPISPGQLANLTIMNKPITEKGAQVTTVFIDGRKFKIDRDDRKKGDRKDKKDASAADTAENKPDADQPDAGPTFDSEIRADRLPSTKTRGNVLLTNATIIPVTSPTLHNASILIQNGTIAAIGNDVAAPAGTHTVDATGKFIIPGFVDPHSHLGIDAVNESPLAISAEVRIADVINPESVGLYRALAGGTTTHHLMHGSANPIGGQCVVTKLKYTRPVSEMIVADAPPTIKFALGENVKQSNFPTAWDKRFPNTRMGVEATMRLAFNRAQAYQAEWADYKKRSAGGEDVLPPRTDLRLEALADVLAGEMVIHCHSYRSEEILRLFAVAEDYGIRVGTLHHVLEGYRIAPEIARHGSGASSFANSWAYKVEAYGAIPHNAALMTEFGVNSSLNSDSPDTIRYLGQEAAKCVRWGNMDENAALRLVTLHPAMQLGVDHRVGSLEVGKDGDLAVFNGHPLNSFSRNVMTLIEGEIYFDDAGPDPSGAALARLGQPLAAPPPPARIDRTIPPSRHRAYVIANATVHPMRSGADPATTIQGCKVVIVNDRVYAVGEDAPEPPGAGVIDGTGLHVYPGIIDAGGALGMSEIGAVRATEDHREIGSFNPHLLAITAIHPFSEHLRVARAVGITTAVARPSGGRVAGQSTIVHLDGWTSAEMALNGSFALHASVPSLPVNLAAEAAEHDHADLHSGCMSDTELDERAAIDSLAAGDPQEEAKKKRREEHKKSMLELEEYWDRAVLYAKVKGLAAKDPAVAFESDIALEAMVPYVRGEKPMVLQASTYKEILDTLEFAEKRKVRIVLAGGAESWKLADQLAAKQIPVILSSPTTMPSSEFEPWDSVYRCAAVLDRAGVKFCFGSGSAADAYNLPIEVGLAVAHGLPQERAEFALTRGAAEILGLGPEYGSVAPGSVADLIVTTDSPLQATAQVTHAFIAGRPVDLSNIHSESYEKFRNRPRPKLPPVPTLRGPKSLSASR